MIKADASPDLSSPPPRDGGDFELSVLDVETTAAPSPVKRMSLSISIPPPKLNFPPQRRPSASKRGDIPALVVNDGPILPAQRRPSESVRGQVPEPGLGHDGSVPTPMPEEIPNFGPDFSMPNDTSSIAPGNQSPREEKPPPDSSLRTKFLNFVGLLDVEGKLRTAMHPSCGFLTFWTWCNALLLCFIALVLPVRIAFEADLGCSYGLIYFDMFIDIFFIVDIFLNFFTAFPLYGSFEFSRKKIAMNYLKGLHEMFEAIS